MFAMIMSCLFLPGLHLLWVRPVCLLGMLMWKKSSHSVGGFGKSPLSLSPTGLNCWCIQWPKTVAASLYWSDGFIWCDNVALRWILQGLHDYMTNLPVTMAKCHHHSRARRSDRRKKSQRLDFYQSITDLPINFRSLFVTRLTSQTARPSEMWQTLENPSLCFCFSHPSLPKFSSLWLGGRRFPNKLAETCCLWVRPSSPPAGHQSCHPQCKQVALASQGERAERVGVTQATPIQNSQLTSKPRLWLSSPIFGSFGFPRACVYLSLAIMILFF